MEYSFNNVTIAGNVTDDVEIKTAANKKKYCFVRIAVNRPYGGSDLVSVKFYDKDAQMCMQIKKGDAVVAVGENTLESKIDSNGKKTYYNFITGKSIARQLMPGESSC